MAPRALREVADHRRGGKPETDGLSAKFIENAWHFRIYADITQQYEDEGFVAKEDRSLGAIHDEDYDGNSFCAGDDEMC